MNHINMTEFKSFKTFKGFKTSEMFNRLNESSHLSTTW
jgi:hypothetical protein